MTTGLDEATFVCIAACALDVDETELLADADLAAISEVVVAVASAAPGFDQAAAVVAGCMERRPFGSSRDERVAWLAAVVLLEEQSIHLRADAAVAQRVLDAARTSRRALMSELRRAVARWPWRVCPVCCRRVYVDRYERGLFISPGDDPYERTARCAFEHGVHDRVGRGANGQIDEPTAKIAWAPVVATGPCGSVLVVADEGAFVFGQSNAVDEWAVAVFDSTDAGALVGSWARLFIDAVGVVDATDLLFDRAHERVNWGHLIATSGAWLAVRRPELARA